MLADTVVLVIHQAVVAVPLRSAQLERAVAFRIQAMAVLVQHHPLVAPLLLTLVAVAAALTTPTIM